jgi:hypothetical protein
VRYCEQGNANAYKQSASSETMMRSTLQLVGLVFEHVRTYGAAAVEQLLQLLQYSLLYSVVVLCWLELENVRRCSSQLNDPHTIDPPYT